MGILISESGMESRLKRELASNGLSAIIFLEQEAKASMTNRGLIRSRVFMNNVINEFIGISRNGSW
jgi:hypothetical protein